MGFLSIMFIRIIWNRWGRPPSFKHWRLAYW